MQDRHSLGITCAVIAFVVLAIVSLIFFIQSEGFDNDEVTRGSSSQSSSGGAASGFQAVDEVVSSFEQRVLRLSKIATIGDGSPVMEVRASPANQEVWFARTVDGRIHRVDFSAESIRSTGELAIGVGRNVQVMSFSSDACRIFIRDVGTAQYWTVDALSLEASPIKDLATVLESETIMSMIGLSENRVLVGTNKSRVIALDEATGSLLHEIVASAGPDDHHSPPTSMTRTGSFIAVIPRSEAQFRPPTWGPRIVVDDARLTSWTFDAHRFQSSLVVEISTNCLGIFSQGLFGGQGIYVRLQEGATTTEQIVERGYFKIGVVPLDSGCISLGPAGEVIWLRQEVLEWKRDVYDSTLGSLLGAVVGPRGPGEPFVIGKETGELLLMSWRP